MMSNKIFIKFEKKELNPIVYKQSAFPSAENYLFRLVFISLIMFLFNFTNISSLIINIFLTHFNVNCIFTF